MEIKPVLKWEYWTLDGNCQLYSCAIDFYRTEFSRSCYETSLWGSERCWSPADLSFEEMTSRNQYLASYHSNLPCIIAFLSKACNQTYPNSPPCVVALPCTNRYTRGCFLLLRNVTVPAVGSYVWQVQKRPTSQHEKAGMQISGERYDSHMLDAPELVLQAFRKMTFRTIGMLLDQAKNLPPEFVRVLDNRARKSRARKCWYWRWTVCCDCERSCKLTRNEIQMEESAGILRVIMRAYGLLRFLEEALTRLENHNGKWDAATLLKSGTHERYRSWVHTLWFVRVTKNADEHFAAAYIFYCFHDNSK